MMKQPIVAKLKLRTTPEQFQALRQTQLAYRDALNYVSTYAYEHGKMSNKVRLQDGTYRQIRARFKIPAQMAAPFLGKWQRPTSRSGRRSRRTPLFVQPG